ncbi:carbonic anhydrase [Fistulifera solaris]|uniref:Carbonic anhydrase n=1 Tax=Fistulifera solaris TaxID=1519565 RepID=A0A1Z5JUR8_FISSO|nr:carbonic anhydrase [Fistulifera solaris]|eukprot:GAX17777.1 carbonic anhydrase [Fistulifera solaris]
MKLLVKLALLTSAVAMGAEFTYFEEGGVGPSHWANLHIEDNQCGGTLMTSGYGQSPVAIFDQHECETDMSAYSFQPGDCSWDDLIFSIGSHGVKVSKGEGCSLGSMTIPHTSNTFDALHFHVHTSSEHTIDGHFYEAELHVVHQEETGESLAVFGMMLSSSREAEDHAGFENLLRGWEKVANLAEAECADANRRQLENGFEVIQQRVTCPAIGTGLVEELPFADPEEILDVYDLPTTPKFGVYTYKGGLTTPPCTEIVNWNVLDTPTLISQNQMDRLYKLTLCYVDTETCQHATIASRDGFTSRPPQNLMGRKIVHRCRVCEKCDTIVDSAPTFIMNDDEQTEESINVNYGDDDENLGLALGLFAAGATLLLLAFVAYHVYALQQAQRNHRLAVSNRIAQHIALTKSTNQLSRVEIITELEKYGEFMTKVQFEDLIGSGKVGCMTDGDANALFAALDDGKGKAKSSEVVSMLLSAGSALHAGAITDDDSA